MSPPPDGAAATGPGGPPPGSIKDLAPGDTTGKLKLTVTGGTDVTVDFVVATETGGIQVVAQEKVAGSTVELSVPAHRDGDVWVNVWKDEKGDGPDPSDPVGFASKAIQFNKPENTLTITMGVGTKPPAGSPYQPEGVGAPPNPSLPADASAPPAAADGAAAPAGSPPPAEGAAPAGSPPPG